VKISSHLSPLTYFYNKSKIVNAVTTQITKGHNMSNKAIITFEYLVVNSLLIVNALDQEYRMEGYFGCATALTISYIYCLKRVK
jgi:hypothetical protein